MKYLKYFESNNNPVKVFNIIINLLNTLGIESKTGYFNNKHTLFVNPNLSFYSNSILSILINILTYQKNTLTYLAHKDNNNTFNKEKLNIVNDSGEDTFLTKNVTGQGDILYKNSINAIIKFIKNTTSSKLVIRNDFIEVPFIKNIILRFLNHIQNLNTKGTIEMDFLYKIIFEEITNYNLNHKLLNHLKKNNNVLYNNIIKHAGNINILQSNELDEMGFMDNYNLYKSFKKESPMKQGSVSTSIKNEPIEGGIILIISKPFPDMTRRIYMAVINNVRKDNETKTERADIVNQFSILKLYSDGNVYPEKVMMSDEQRYKLLGMKTTGLYMNHNKTPLWEISSGLKKPQFFTQYQSLIKDLPNKYKNVIFPITHMKEKPNLHL